MSRSKDTKLSGDPAIAEAARKMDTARRRERRALERVKKTGNPEHRRLYINLTREADKAEDDYREATKIRDTGWIALPTSHGTRFHRERGKHLQFDVELQVTTWICACLECNVLRKTIRGHAEAHLAAAAIEEAYCIPSMPLPEEVKKL